MAALRRDGNVLGALSLVVADEMSDAVALAADESLAPKLRRRCRRSSTSPTAARSTACAHPRPDLVGHRAARGPAGRRGRGAPAQGTGRAHDEHRAHRGRAARRAAGDRRACRRARGRAGRPLPRRTRRPRALAARALEGAVRRKLARDAGRLHALDLPAVRPAGMWAPRRPLPGGGGGGCCCCCCAGVVRRASVAPRGAKQHHRGERRWRWPGRPRVPSARRFRAVRAPFATSVR